MPRLSDRLSLAASLPALLLPAFILLAAGVARAEPSQQQWFTVLLDGRKIGSFEATRRVEAATVTTTQTLELVLDRVGTRISLGSSETSIETRDGEPLAFRSATRLSGSESVTDGVVKGDVVDVTVKGGGQSQRRSIEWPVGALLAEGQRLAAARAGLAPGTHHELLTFQPSTLTTVRVGSAVGAPERVELPGGAPTLVPVDQTIEFPGAPMKSRIWVDADQSVHKMTMPLMGVELVLLACDKTCATAPNQGTDVFERTLARAPRALGAQELAGTLRHTLAARDGGAPLSLPETDEQQVRREGDRWLVTIGRHGAANRQSPPVAADLQPNDWLQSTAPELVALARRATGDATTPQARMQRIEAFVRQYISTKSLDVGYASALEVVNTPEGDCTEHAVLVAALGRASGIPTRVVDGLAYAPGFGGKDQVFVPHAWTQAWVDGRWQGYDAALDGFDAGHIALAIGNGDPWHFYAGLDMLGRIRIERSDAVPATASP